MKKGVFRFKDGKEFRAVKATWNEYKTDDELKERYDEINPIMQLMYDMTESKFTRPDEQFGIVTFWQDGILRSQTVNPPAVTNDPSLNLIPNRAYIDLETDDYLGDFVEDEDVI